MSAKPDRQTRRELSEWYVERTVFCAANLSALTFFYFSCDISKRTSMTHWTLESPVCIAYLLTMAWVFWVPPAYHWKRVVFVVLLVLLSWLNSRTWNGFAIAFVSHLLVVALYSINCAAIGLMGFDVIGTNCRIEDTKAQTFKYQFHIWDITVLTFIIALVSAVIRTCVSDGVLVSLLCFVGFTWIASSLQKGFTSDSNNRNWVIFSLAVSAVLIVTIFGVKTVQRLELQAGPSRYFSFDVLITTVERVTFFVGSACIFPAIAGWLLVVQRGRSKTKQRLLEALQSHRTKPGLNSTNSESERE